MQEFRLNRRCPPQSHSYCGLVKNLTVAIEEEVYRKARVLAAESGTSVSALVRDHLREITGEKARLREDLAETNRLMEALPQQTAGFRIGSRPTREEMNER